MPRTSSCCVCSRYAAASPMRTRSAHAASCLLRVAGEHLFAAAAPDPLFGSTLFVWLVGWLFVCLFVCLLVCLRRAFAKHTVDGAAYAARATSRGDGLFAACCTGVRCACTGALPPTPCRTSALHQCVCVEYPRRRECCANIIASSPRRVAAPTDLVACEHPIAHGCKAVAEAVIGAVACSGSRCSSP